MTDKPSSRNTSIGKASYRLCSACGILVRRSEWFCPECGAPLGETHPGDKPAVTGKAVFRPVILLALAGALFLFSLHRQTAREEEDLRFTRLAPLERPAPALPARPQAPIRPHQPAEPPPPPQPEAPLLSETVTPPSTRAEPPLLQVGRPDPNGDDPWALPHPLAPLLPVDAPPPADPEPVAPAAPPSRSELIQQRRDELAERFARILDENHPMHRPGDRITLRLNDGTTQTGILLQLASGQVQLRLPTGEARWFLSRQLAPETRVRVDPSERQTLVQERALQEALQEMESAQ